MFFWLIECVVWLWWFAYVIDQLTGLWVAEVEVSKLSTRVTQFHAGAGENSLFNSYVDKTVFFEKKNKSSRAYNSFFKCFPDFQKKKVLCPPRLEEAFGNFRECFFPYLKCQWRRRLLNREFYLMNSNLLIYFFRLKLQRRNRILYVANYIPAKIVNRDKRTK